MEKLADARFFRYTGKEFIFVNATLTNRDVDDKSPGSPSAPIPLLYALKSSLSEKRFSGCFGESPI